MGDRVAIIGSRDFADLDAVRAFVRGLPVDTVVVSGGARGVDRVAAAEAQRCGLTIVVYRADWIRYGRRAGYLRNVSIVEHAERVVAFWDGASKGTRHTIEIARRAGTPVEIREAR